MDDILTDFDGGVLVVTIDRPQRRNALTRAMYDALAGALARADGDDTVRAVLLRGSEAVFSAGNDIGDFLDARDPAPAARFIRGAAACRKPMIAAVCGPAVGIGTTILLHFDLVYAGDNAMFSTPFVDLGLCPEAGSSLLAPQALGYHRAAALLLLGEPLAAAEALARRIDDEGATFSRLLSEPPAREALTAFREKRRPDFSRF